MEQSEATQGNQAFGSYLKKVREGRRLSLDAVEELSAAFPEKVTKSHLSRIENGLALPSFPRLMALSHIYGMPIASLAERYELDLRRGMAPVDLGGKSDEVLIGDATLLADTGRYSDSIVLLLAMLERGESVGTQRETLIRLELAFCLVRSRRLELAKVVCEDLLSSNTTSRVDRLRAFLLFAGCCRDLGRFAMALMALDQVGAELGQPDTPPRLAADVSALRGMTYLSMGDVPRAIDDLQRAKAQYDTIPSKLESCKFGVALGEALILASRYDEASQVISAELAIAERNGFEMQRASAFSHLALMAYRMGDLASAEANAIRSNALARPMDHVEIVFRNCFYLWRVAGKRNDTAAAKMNERTLRATLGRIDEQSSEAQEFRRYLARGEGQ